LPRKGGTPTAATPKQATRFSPRGYRETSKQATPKKATRFTKKKSISNQDSKETTTIMSIATPSPNKSQTNNDYNTNNSDDDPIISLKTSLLQKYLQSRPQLSSPDGSNICDKRSD
jgi:hypothetical protein